MNNNMNNNQNYQNNNMNNDMSNNQNYQNNNMNNNNSNNNNNGTITNLDIKIEAVIVYLIPVIGLIFSILKNQQVRPEARFHYNQAATSFLISIVVSVFAFVPFVGWIIVAIIPTYDFIMRVVALIKAFYDELYQIPIEFNLTQKIWHTFQAN